MKKLRVVLGVVLATATLGLGLFMSSSASAVTCTPGPGLDLTGCDFTGMDLVGVNLDGSNLTSANLTGANLQNASLLGTNFSCANLSSANLADANLKGAKIGGANFRDAALTGVRSGGISGSVLGSCGNRFGLPGNWIQVQGYLIGDGANLENEDLSANWINLNDKTFLGLRVAGANIQTFSLRHSTVSVVGTPASIPSGFAIVNGYLVGLGTDMRNLSFVNGDFLGADIRGTDFSGSDLTGANLVNTLVGQADFTGATLNQTKVAGIDLRLARLDRVSTEGLIGAPASLPAGFRLVQGFILGPGVSLKSKDLSRLDLQGIDLSGANLEGSNLSGSNLTSANLSNSFLDGVNFDSASLSGLKATGLQGPPSVTGLSANWLVRCNVLVGPGANLSGANLSNSNCDFSNVNLTGANLTGANFGQTGFSNATLDNAVIRGANFANANLQTCNAVGLISDQSTLLPQGFRISNGDLLRPMIRVPSQFISGSMQVGTVASSQRSIWDDGVSLSYKWLLDGVVIQGQTAAEYTIATKDLGHSLQLEVTATRQGYDSVTLATPALTVLLGKLVNVPTPELSGVSKVGSEVTALAGQWSSGTVTAFQWLVDGRPLVPNATNYKYLITGFEAGRQLQVQVTYSATGFEPRNVVSAPVTVAQGTMKFTTPRMTGTAKVGKILAGSSPLWAPNAKFSYQWLLDGKKIPGATKSTYKLLPAQKGRKISLQVTQSATGYATATKVSTSVKVG